MTKTLKKIKFDELANWSPWPSRLLSITPFEKKIKTPKSVEREFGNDKWGKLLKNFSNKKNFSHIDVETSELNKEEIIACFEKNFGFYSTSVNQANKRQIEIFKDNLSPYIKNASCLVELGAGYGSKIFSLSKFKNFRELPILAAEYTKSGRDLIRLISKKSNKTVKVGKCDFDSLTLSGFEIPKNSIIFTSFSVHYVKKLKKKFVEFIAKFEPKAVVHFEPCYEYYNDNSLHGLMCKRYMEINGYTLNIASAINNGCLKIKAKQKVYKNVFGSNPFLPFSVIKWFPKTKYKN